MQPIDVAETKEKAALKDINVKNKALLHYKVSYLINNEALEWTTIRKNIRDKQPVAMSVFNKKIKVMRLL